MTNSQFNSTEFISFSFSAKSVLIELNKSDVCLKPGKSAETEISLSIFDCSYVARMLRILSCLSVYLLSTVGLLQLDNICLFDWTALQSGQRLEEDLPHLIRFAFVDNWDCRAFLTKLKRNCGRVSFNFDHK